MSAAVKVVLLILAEDATSLNTAHLLWRQMAQITLRKQFHQIIFITVFAANASRSKSKGRISASSMRRHVRSVRLRNFERICQRLNGLHVLYVSVIFPVLLCSVSAALWGSEVERCGEKLSL